MNQTQGEEAIANADNANDRFLASLESLEEWRASNERLLQDGNGQSSPNENQDAISLIDAVLVAANEARAAEEIAIRLNISRRSQQAKVRESHRVWNEQIREYEAQRSRILSGTPATQVLINSPSDQDPQTFYSEVVFQSASDHSSEDDSLAGTFCLVGGALIAIGAFFPYFVETSILGTVDRNAFQLGPLFSMTYQGPLIVITGVLLILRGLTLKEIIGSNSPHPWSPLEWSPLVISTIAAIAVLDAWLGTSSSPDVTFNRGFGGIVSLVGVLSGLVAMYIHRRNLR